MSAVIETNKSINVKEYIDEFKILMEKVIADNSLKNDIENTIVRSGEKFIPDLVSYIQSAKGFTRGMCAMALIRIGDSCVSFLQEAAKNNVDFAWAADYIINEIRC